MQVGAMMNRLKKHGDGIVRKMSPTQIKAYEVVLSRLVPTLSAVEQTVINENDRLSESELSDKIMGILAARPDLLDKALAMRAKATSEPLKAVA